MASLDPREIRAFVQAAAQGQLHQVRDLLATGMPVNARGPQQGTALELAAYQGHLDVVRTLLDAGADLEHTSGDWPILVFAANGGHPEVVRLLLDRGVDPNRASAAGMTPLLGAALSGSAPVVGLLLAAGADPHFRSGWMLRRGTTKTALDFAQDNRKKDVIPLLAAAMGIPAEEIEDIAYAAVKQLRHNADTPAFQALLQRLAKACGKPPVPYPKRKGVFRCYLRDPAPGQLEALQSEVRAAGFQLVLYDAVPGPAKTAKLMIFPTTEKFAVVVARGTSGVNYGLTTRALIAWLRNLDKENPFDLTGCGFDFLEGRFPAPVRNAEHWAQLMVELCPDCESPAKVMGELRRQRFFFWWD